MKRLTTTLAAVAVALSASAQTHQFDINTSKLGAPIQPTMYGIFFEDINYAADGGLYGELVKNRSFEFPNHFMGWSTFGKVEMRREDPAFQKNPRYVRLLPSGHSDKFTGVENEGFFGIGYEKGAEYKFSVWARSGRKPGKIRVMFCDPNTQDERQQFTEGTIDINTSGKWVKHELTLKANKTVAKGTLGSVTRPYQPLPGRCVQRR